MSEWSIKINPLYLGSGNDNKVLTGNSVYSGSDLSKDLELQEKRLKKAAFLALNSHFWPGK